MAEPAKFLFDTEFDVRAITTRLAPTDRAKVYWTEEERDDACAQAFEEGRQAGIQETNAQTTSQTTTALETIANLVTTISGQLEDERAKLKSEGVILAGMIARSLASALVQQQPIRELEALLDDALNFMPGNPHIAVRITQEHLEMSKESLAAIADDRGFTGKLLLSATDNVQPGDCRIEWANGSIIKDHTEIKKKIHAMTAQYIHSEHENTAAELENFNYATFLPTGEPDKNDTPETVSGLVDETSQSEDI